jgi:spore maturation protein CgeB
MRILFVASLHHPEALRAAQAAAPPGGPVPLFPPSMAQHFWEKALRKRGHTLDVFWRNLPAFAPLAERETARFRDRPGPARLAAAALGRVPPAFNPDVRARNRRLRAHARRFQPDVLWMVGDNTVIAPDTLAAIKAETGARVVYACGTSPIVFSHAIDRAAARLYDLVLASDYYHGVQWLELGAQRMECLPLAACDPDFHRPYPLSAADRAARACAIAFVGTLVPHTLYSRRVRALEALREFDLGIWSVHDVPASLRPFVRGRALGEEMERILSAGSLCFNTHGDFVHYGGNLRLFEVAGAGVCQITDDLPGVRAWFPPDADGPLVFTYADLHTLRDGVRALLADDARRQHMAERARAHVLAHHTYDHRAARFDALIASLP